MTSAVRQHFIDALDRPELLNRIGDNIVVFNFISREAASEIFETQLNRVIRMVQHQQGIEVSLSGPAWTALHEAATAPSVLEFGGRGIGSFLERAFVNPLARELFSAGTRLGETLTVTEIHSGNGQWALSLQPTPHDRENLPEAT